MSSDGGGSAPRAAPSGAKAQLDVGVVVADAYEITHLLGKGGMGAVWAARHLRLPGKRVAIKVLLGGMEDAQALARFRREAEVASRIGHAGIVEVLDFNQLADGTPYQVLEFLAGESLGARLARGRLPLETALDYARQIGSALAAAHRAGVVHRDLKPENIFLCPTDAGGVVSERVKILDFGISKIRGSATVKTQDQVLIGTPQYMAPEQASGQNAAIDARTDLFALSAIVYEMLAGRPAFSGESVVAVIMNVVTGTPPALATVAPGVPPAVVAAVERALAKQPDERFADVASFIEALTGRPLQTLDGGAASPSPRRVTAPLSQEEMLDATVAPGSAVPAVPPSPTNAGGAPTGAPPIAVTVPPAPRPRAVLWPAALVVVAAGAVAYAFATRTSAPPAPLASVPERPRAPEQPLAPAPAPPPVAATATSEGAAPPSAVVENRRAPRVRPEEHLSDDVRADLDAADSALARGDTREAKRLAQHSLLGQKTSRAFAIITRAACQDRDLTNARAGLRNVGSAERSSVVRTCAAKGIDLR
jgi:serine/threonine-protein kinase